MKTYTRYKKLHHQNTLSTISNFTFDSTWKIILWLHQDLWDEFIKQIIRKHPKIIQFIFSKRHIPIPVCFLLMSVPMYVYLYLCRYAFPHSFMSVFLTMRYVLNRQCTLCLPFSMFSKSTFTISVNANWHTNYCNRSSN